VELRAITSTGSVIEIIKTSPPTDMFGHFNYEWVPPAPGDYTIVARYLGDDAYFPSYTATGLKVGSISPTPSATITTATPDYTIILVGILVAMIMLIVIAIYGIYNRRKSQA
jgi:hypothetical protein